MKIFDNSRLDASCASVSTSYHAKGHADASREALVPMEHVLDIYINEILTMRVVCTPDDLVELVVGRLFTEGIIASIDEVETLYLCEFGSRARVFLKDREADFTRSHVETVPSCCTGNHVLNSYFTDGHEPEKVKPISWEDDWIYAMAEEFEADSPIHKSTLGTHSCRLALEGKVLVSREDIGRHNAFDKVVGYALIQSIDLTKAIVFTSGRTPVDMVLKAIRARIPILVTKAVPTDMTVDLARKFDLTLICKARKDSLYVFNDPRSTA